MKNIFLLITLLSSSFSFAQKSVNIVEYNYTTTQSEYFFNEFLVFNSNNFTYFGYGKGGELTTYEQVRSSFDKRKISYYIEKDDNNLFYMGYKTPKIKRITIDNFSPIKWQILNESKNILDYKCIKAVGEFRGRKYIAWFTTDISASYGPWKLGGLPGLILEAEDDKGIFKFTARRIILNSNMELPPQLNEYISEKKKTIVPFKEYIELENEYKRELRGQVLADFPIGSTIMKQSSLRESEIEIIFEWEKEPVKF